MKITEIKKITSKNGILFEGLPGIGNVGKIAADYLVEQLKAKKIASIKSNKFPNLVIINEENLIDMPELELYHKKILNKDYFFLLGDFQPSTEEGSYELSELLIDYCKNNEIKQIVTLGGIGLEMPPEIPEVFVTGNNRKFVDSINAKKELYGKVGTILGVTGLLLGLSGPKISAAALLVETSYEPGATVLDSVKKLVESIASSFKLKVKTKDLEEDFMKAEEKHISEIETIDKLPKVQETNYIG